MNYGIICLDFYRFTWEILWITYGAGCLFINVIKIAQKNCCASLDDKIKNLGLAFHRFIYDLLRFIADDPNTVWYIICGVIIAMLSVGVIIILVAVTIR